MRETIRTPVEMLAHWVATRPDAVFLRQPLAGHYRDYTWREVNDSAQRVAGALRELGLQPGAAVALLAKNCAEWFIADLAIMLGGYISVPVYPTANAETIAYILEHSEAQAVFLGQLDRPDQQSRAVGGTILRLGLSHESVAVDQRWDELLTLGSPLRAEPLPQPDQTMTIVYTSGSTGRPKGVVHTFASLSWAGATVSRDLQATTDDRTVSYLPLAHITERAYIELGSFYAANTVAFIESRSSFLEDVKRARPTLFISVPRLWALFREQILTRFGARKLDVLLTVPRLSEFIGGRLRHALGLGHARLLGCGSAPVAPELIVWFAAIGLEISEGWGMTENAAYGTIQIPFRADKIGSVGRPALNAEIKVSADGELLFRSPGLMLGYHKREASTHAAIDADGFLRSGDLGRIDSDGYVYITGRVKDIFKTAKGLYVAPAPIEMELARSASIELACVVGAGQPQPAALVQLSGAAEAAPRDQTRAALQTLLDALNLRLAHHERLDAMIVLSEPWSVENDLLTPTLKVKRHVLEKRFGALTRNVRDARVHWQEELES